MSKGEGREVEEVLEAFPDIWKTEAQLWSYIRGGIRRGLWEKNPIKLEYIRSKRVRVPLGKITEKNPEGLVWGCKCEVCGKLFRQGECQVDHLLQTGSVRTKQEIREFIEKLIFVTFEDLQIACKGCHDIKTLAERYNLTFEEASNRKLVIFLMKLEKEDIVKILLRQFFYKRSQTKTKKAREEILTELVSEGKIIWTGNKRGKQWRIV